MAGIAGVEPWEYTLQELCWRGKAVRMEEWDKYAWICMHIPSFSKSGKQKRLSDFNPLRQQQKNISIDKLNRIIATMKDKMPDTMPEDELLAKLKRLADEHG